ncbi:MAG: AAA family ATPase [Bauldia sp.]
MTPVPNRFPPDGPDGPLEPPPEPLRPLTLKELFALDIKPPQMLLEPILSEKGLGMLYAPRGVGKTLLALSISYAVATGGELLGWKARGPRTVLHVDGEMPIAMLRDRMAGIVGGAGMDRLKAAGESFRLLAADAFEGGLPNLNEEAAQRQIEAMLAGVDLLTLDNHSTLAAALNDNDADSWSPMQRWLLRLRRAGHSGLLVHHAGKAGLQRGTSRREDVLDTVIALKRPADYLASQGARFEVHFDKLRGVFGAAATPFEARLGPGPAGGLVWSRSAIGGEAAEAAEKAQEKEDRAEEIRWLAVSGLTDREIAERLGLSRSVVQRLRTAAPYAGQTDA